MTRLIIILFLVLTPLFADTARSAVSGNDELLPPTGSRDIESEKRDSSASLRNMVRNGSRSARRVVHKIDDNDRVILRGNVHHLARPEFDMGASEPTLPMERMILSLRLSNESEAELDRRLSEQQDPTSPNFHRWLTPEEFGERFGPAPEDVVAISEWLTSHGLTVEEVGKARSWINFSGPVSHVERAFRTHIHNYSVGGRQRHANSDDPAIPRAIADVVSGVVSMNNFPRKAMNTGIRPLAKEELQPAYTSSTGKHSLTPGDFASIYNVSPLYDAGIDGSGQSIAIVGRTHTSSTNWTTFRTLMELPDNPPQVIVNGTDPGDLGGDEDGEADLDVEWSGAVARNATIKFVVSNSTRSSDGIDLSAQYIVNKNLAPIMSISFGQCESVMGASNSFYNNLWKQAASQGITVFAAAGDSGAAGCNYGSDSSGSGLGVSGIASTPYNVAVGGTQFNEGYGSYWNSSNGTGKSSVFGYIPEIAWNESGSMSGGSELWAGSGGVSSIYAKPSWQTGPGVPADGRRDIPDVSLTAAAHDGYRMFTKGSWQVISGTSAAAPSFAGLMALVVQKTGQRQGNANPRLYQLANAQYTFGGAKVFNDITSGNNSVPGVTGFTSGPGFDLATGLGSVNAEALVNNWSSMSALTFTITPVAGPNGSIDPSTAQTVSEGGSSSALTAIPASGYRFVDWTAPDGFRSSVNPLVVSNVSADQTLTANFAANANTVTPSAGSNGSINPSTPQPVGYNASTSFTITPANGYRTASVSGCGGSLNGSIYTTGAITGACTVSATFSVISSLGDLNGDGKTDISDALKALKIAVGTITPSASELAAGDVSPLVNGVPAPDGKIDISDALAILKKAIGLSTW